MGLVAQADEVVTSALATAEYIAEESPGASVYMLGGSGLKHALTDKGLVVKEDEFVDYVVIGLMRPLPMKISNCYFRCP